MDDRVLLRVRRTRGEADADISLPAPETSGSAGLDLRAAVTSSLTLLPGERALVPTGLSIAVPPGWEAQVRPRSGLALRHGVTLLNSPGTIDSDYRGEVSVIAINLGQAPFVVSRGDRIAQLVLARHGVVQVEVVEELDDTARGAGGFGHTGVG